VNKRSTDLADVMYVLNDYVVPKIAFFGFTCPLSLTNLVFESIVQKNFYTKTRLVRLIEFSIGSHKKFMERVY